MLAYQVYLFLSPIFALFYASPITLCSECDNDRYDIDRQVKQFRIELVKLQILDKLRLPEAPNVDVSEYRLPLPITNTSIWKDSRIKHQEFIDEESKNEDSINQKLTSTDFNEFYGKVDQITLFSTNVPVICDENSVCFDIKLSDKINDETLNDAFLWIYTLNVGKVYISSTIGEYIKDSQTEGWIQINLRKVLKMWLTNTDENIINIRISQNGTFTKPVISLKPSYKPFLSILIIDNNQNKRTKRNINCSPGTNECCREQLNISFEEIGWSNWIIEPKYYTAYFCKGSCTGPGSLTQSTSHHAAVLQTYRNKVANKKFLSPCCTPTKLKPLQVIYMNDNNTIVDQTLPNMIVESCGCL